MSPSSKKLKPVEYEVSRSEPKLKRYSVYNTRDVFNSDNHILQGLSEAFLSLKSRGVHLWGDLVCETQYPFHLLTRIVQDCERHGRPQQAFRVLKSFYSLATAAQLAEAGNAIKHNPRANLLDYRYHKGHLTFELSRYFDRLGYTWHSNYYLALTLAEDALSHFFLVPDGCKFAKLLVETDFTRVRSSRSTTRGGLDLEKLAKQLDVRFNPRTGEGSSYYEALQLHDRLLIQIQRFWQMTGLCELLSQQYRVTVDVVMSWVQSIAQSIFFELDDKTITSLNRSPISLFKNVESRGFARLRNPQKLAWGPEFLMFPEWVCGQASLFDFLHTRVSLSERNDSPFADTYYGFLSHLLTSVAKDQYRGILFEELCGSLLSSCPGIRIFRNADGPLGELDIIGFVHPDCSELHLNVGQYFLAECKFWNKSVGTSEVDALMTRAKRIGAKTAIVMSQYGLSGSGTTQHAAFIAKLQGNKGDGVHVKSISERELKVCSSGTSFLKLLERIDKCGSTMAAEDHCPLCATEELIELPVSRILKRVIDEYRFGFYQTQD